MDFINKIKAKNNTPEHKFLSTKIVDLLNYRINQEELSSRIYLAFSIALQDKAYFNAAKLYKKYSEEELAHAQKARNYLLSFNILPKTEPIGEVENIGLDFESIIHKTLAHETLITSQCKELAKACMDEQDHITYTLASFYLNEQVEEMEKSWDLVNHLETFGADKISLKLLDNYIGELL